MNPFSVYVEFAEQQADLDTYDCLLQALPKRFQPAVGPAENGNVSVRLLIKADSVVDAFNLGTKAAKSAGVSIGITPDALIHTEVMPEPEFDRRQDQLLTPAVPPLVGPHEAADMLGISDANLADLAAELEPHLVQHLEVGPVYRASGVAEVADRHALAPAERALLDVLLAASLHALLPTTSPTHQAAATAVAHVLEDGTVQIRRLSGEALNVGAALHRLAGRSLIVLNRTAAGPHGQPSNSSFESVRITTRGQRHSECRPSFEESQYSAR